MPLAEIDEYLDQLNDWVRLLGNPALDDENKGDRWNTL